MSKIDLTTLPPQELRQLLDSARQRGHAAQSYEILREMDARRAGPGLATIKVRRRSRRQPRLIELQLGDPLETLVKPFEAPDDDRPLTLGQGASPPPSAVPPSRERQRWGHWAALCFAAGLASGVAAGLWAGWGGAWAPPAPVVLASAPRTAARPRLPVTVAEAPAPVTPLAPPPPVADVQLATAGDTSGAVAASLPPADASAPVVSASTQSDAHQKAAPAQTHVAQVEPAETGCAAQSTPADELICSQPRLRVLQAELRRAYAEALEAHRDRSLLRQRQLAWREGRNAISNPDQLARLYTQRIVRLKAATAEATRER